MYNGCEGHCIKSGWFCHHVDVESRVATVHRKYRRDEHPFDFAPSELLEGLPERTILDGTVRFFLGEEAMNWRNPPAEWKTKLSVATCEGIRCGPKIFITLPLE
jgi:hypothetical protein